jgi:hypothetical protein
VERRQLPQVSFDEEFYRRTHADVDAAVAAGSFDSGLHHYRLHGRDEGRVFRLLAPVLGDV